MMRKAVLAVLVVLLGSALVHGQNAIYATQLTFESKSPMIYAIDGICIETATKRQGRIEVLFPPMAAIIAEQFKGMHKNLAYIVKFAEQSAALVAQSNGFYIESEQAVPWLSEQGLSYNVSVADVSVGVQFDVAKAACHLEVGTA